MLKLEVENLTCRIWREGRWAPLVQNVSFALEKGKTMALVGESGSGKTTTALSLLRLLSFPRYELSGSVLFEGKNLLTLSSKELSSLRGRAIAMIFQDPESALNPVFTIGYQIREMCELHADVSREEAEERTIAIVRRVGIPRAERCFETYPHELSGGMKQRAMIAMALIASPQILILDEPTTALDLTVQKEILALLKELQREKEMSYLIITHDIGVVAEMADFVAVMYKGQIIEFGEVFSLFERRLHPYTKALFDARPTAERRKQPLPTITSALAETISHEREEYLYDPEDPTHWARCYYK